MGRFFNLDNPFFTFMGRVADIFILNFFCIICCIPIVTIGPSITALYYVSMKMIRNEESYIVKDFFHSFRQNLKQGIIINLIMLAAGIILFMDLSIVRHMEKPSHVLYVAFLVILIIYINVYIYIYPLQAKFFNSIKNTFTNAILMAISHLPYTVVMFIITLVPFLILLIPDAKIQAFLIFVYILTGPALCAFAKSALLVRIFDRYVPKEPEEGEVSETPDEVEGPDSPAQIEGPEIPVGIEDSGVSAGEQPEAGTDE